MIPKHTPSTRHKHPHTSPDHPQNNPQTHFPDKTKTKIKQIRTILKKQNQQTADICVCYQHRYIFCRYRNCQHRCLFCQHKYLRCPRRYLDVSVASADINAASADICVGSTCICVGSRDMSGADADVCVGSRYPCWHQMFVWPVCLASCFWG